MVLLLSWFLLLFLLLLFLLLLWLLYCSRVFHNCPAVLLLDHTAVASFHDSVKFTLLYCRVQGYQYWKLELFCHVVDMRIGEQGRVTLALKIKGNIFRSFQRCTRVRNFRIFTMLTMTCSCTVLVISKFSSYILSQCRCYPLCLTDAWNNWPCECRQHVSPSSFDQKFQVNMFHFA